ncbi:hypothetical protein [Mesorhizobium sp. C372A]|uniref:hypothetical protein n=1 Tax=Mesorhizobium sp. C372A TaxID=2956829 RepID=UPI002575678D|nr:hypothetical protein [Mesorhizobium sp. C372A]WJI90163.1 hypothetical protein NLY42_15625 [Mesorhizobium sp. C372A]
MPPDTLSTTVPAMVSAVLDGLLPIGSAASLTVRSSLEAARPLSDRLMVSVVVDRSPSPSMMV